MCELGKLRMETKDKSVAIITFHASHNYGSMLQTYALQNVVQSFGFRCEVINFRTERQKKFYDPIWKKGTLYERCKRFLLSSFYINEIIKKYDLFENFLKEEINLSTQEFSTLEELNSAKLSYDFYISGSDQIWNTLILDFDWAYFLPFVNERGKKIAYAPSMGPTPELTTIEKENRIIELLKTYSSVSLRERRTAEYFKKLVGVSYPVVLDPTMLLSREDWDRFAGDEPLIAGDYCFCYSPWMNERVLTMASKWAESHHMPVVVSKPFIYLSSIVKWRRIKTYVPVGPKEFLNLCKFAKVVYCDSFHAVVFSIFFKTPFFALDGMSDARISNLLSMTELTDRSVGENDVVEDTRIDFDLATSVISSYKAESSEWLLSALKK